MELLAERKIGSWYICDANFGIHPRDADIVKTVVKLHEQFGYPKVVHTNWAKNSNERIVRLCAQLNKAGIHSTYTLALQSATEGALSLANRKNMKINRIDEIARLCRQHDVVPRGELIWGLPGESYDQFLTSYNKLSEYTDALSVYPLYILPNTSYARDQKNLGIVVGSGDLDTDYTYCIEHDLMSREDFLRGLRFIISNNVLRTGGALFRLYPRVAWLAAKIPYSRSVEGLARWVVTTSHPVAKRFAQLYRFPLTAHRQSLSAVWRMIRDDRDGLLDMVRAYVHDTAVRTADPETARILTAALEFDMATYPIMDSQPMEENTPGKVYIHTATFQYDFLRLKREGEWSPSTGAFQYSISLPKGLWRYPIDSWYFGLLAFQGKVDANDCDTP